MSEEDDPLCEDELDPEREFELEGGTLSWRGCSSCTAAYPRAPGVVIKPHAGALSTLQELPR